MYEFDFVYHITKRKSLIWSKSILPLKLKNSEKLIKIEFLSGGRAKGKNPTLTPPHKKKKGKIENYYQNNEC